MPRDNARNFVPLYALCPQRMVERLTKSKAPGSVFSVVLCLKAYAMDKTSCFPSHKTIQDWCGGEISIRSIERAVKWLEDHSFIKRNSRTSKNRYVLYIDKHVEPKSKPARSDEQTRQNCVHKIKNEDQSSINPKPLKKGLDKKSKVRSQRRRRRQAVAPQPPVLSPQEEARNRSLMVKNALDYIAMTGTANEAHKEVFELLSGSVEGWFSSMSPQKRQVLKIKREDLQNRVYSKIEILSNVKKT